MIAEMKIRLNPPFDQAGFVFAYFIGIWYDIVVYFSNFYVLKHRRSGFRVMSV